MVNKLVSIIVVVKDGGKVLPGFFTAIYEQTYKNLEVIVNDDLRTTDNTRQIVQEWSKNLDIKYVNKNEQPTRGRLEGSKIATGNYLLHLDADMQLTSKVIESCVKLVDDGADAIIIPEEVIGEGFWTKCKWLEKKCYVGDESIESPRFFKKAAYFEVDGHNPELTFGEDKDLDLRFRENNKIVTRTVEYILHNERRITFLKSVQKKFFWSQSSLLYLKLRPKSAVKQGNVLLRPAFFRNWKLLITHPVLTTGMVALKIGEFTGAIAGVIYSEVFKGKITYKHH